MVQCKACSYHQQSLPPYDQIMYIQTLLSDSNIPPRTLVDSTANYFHNKAVQLSPVERIMYDQDLIFHGYIRANILSDLDTLFAKLLSQDVILLCNKFYVINIQMIIEKYHEDAGMEFEYGDKERESKELDSLWDLTDEFCNKKEFFIAYKICTILCEQDPNNGDYHNAIGVVLSDWTPKTEIAECEAAFERSINLDPTNEYHLYHYGYYLLSVQKYEKSLALWDKSINELKSTEPYLNILAAYCHRMLGEINSAYKCYVKALEADSNGTNNGLFADFLATDLHNYERAQFHYKRAIKLAPKDAAAFWNYARLWRDCLQNYTIAEKYYLKSLKLDNGECGTTNAGYAYLLHLMGDDEKAKVYMNIQLGVTNAAQSSWTWIYHGIIFTESAEESLTKAVESVRTKSLCKYELSQLEFLKSRAVNASDTLYFEQFGQMLRNKFEL